MKVGDIIEIDGKKVKITWAQGNNYSYAAVQDVPVEKVAEDVQTTAEEMQPKKRGRKVAKKED